MTMTVGLKCSCCSVEQLDRAQALFLFCLPFLSPPNGSSSVAFRAVSRLGGRRNRPSSACSVSSTEEAFDLQSDSRKKSHFWHGVLGEGSTDVTA